jgi:hypothetical protein
MHSSPAAAQPADAVPARTIPQIAAVLMSFVIFMFLSLLLPILQGLRMQAHLSTDAN